MNSHPIELVRCHQRRPQEHFVSKFLVSISELHHYQDVCRFCFWISCSKPSVRIYYWLGCLELWIILDFNPHHLNHHQFFIAKAIMFFHATPLLAPQLSCTVYLPLQCLGVYLFKFHLYLHSIQVQRIKFSFLLAFLEWSASPWTDIDSLGYLPHKLDRWSRYTSQCSRIC